MADRLAVIHLGHLEQVGTVRRALRLSGQRLRAHIRRAGDLDRRALRPAARRGDQPSAVGVGFVPGQGGPGHPPRVRGPRASSSSCGTPAEGRGEPSRRRRRGSTGSRSTATPRGRLDLRVGESVFVTPREVPGDCDRRPTRRSPPIPPRGRPVQSSSRWRPWVLWRLMSPRLRFVSTRLRDDDAVGAVATRGGSMRSAEASRSFRRSSASALFRAWDLSSSATTRTSGPNRSSSRALWRGPERRRAGYVETHLGAGARRVGVLSARTAAAAEAPGELAGRYREAPRDPQYVALVGVSGPCVIGRTSAASRRCRLRRGSPECRPSRSRCARRRPGQAIAAGSKRPRRRPVCRSR